MDAMAPALTEAATTEVRRLKLAPSVPDPALEPPASAAAGDAAASAASDRRLGSYSNNIPAVRKRLGCLCKKPVRLDGGGGSITHIAQGPGSGEFTDTEPGELLPLYQVSANSKHLIVKGRVFGKLGQTSLHLGQKIMKTFEQNAAVGKQKNGVAKQPQSIRKANSELSTRPVNGKKAGNGDQSALKNVCNSVGLEPISSTALDVHELQKLASTNNNSITNKLPILRDLDVPILNGKSRCEQNKKYHNGAISNVVNSRAALLAENSSCSSDRSACHADPSASVNVSGADTKIDLPNLSPGECPMASRVLSSVHKLAALEQRARRLSKHLRLIQAEQTESHVRQQLGGLVESINPRRSQDSFNRGQSQACLQNGVSVSSAACNRLDGTSSPLCLRSQRLHSSPLERGRNFVFEQSPREELERVSRSLEANLRHVEKALDSDATESSSGGETDVEEERMPRLHVRRRRTSIQTSAGWRWAEERAMVASRWTWLTAQVSDLEYRIRQHNELYRQLRTNKGAVLLGEPQTSVDLMQRLSATGSMLKGPLGGVKTTRVAMSPCSPSMLLSNIHKQSSQLTQALGGMVSHLSAISPGTPAHSKPPMPQLNGTMPGPEDGGCADSSTEGSDMDESEGCAAVIQFPPLAPPDNTCVAARTRPLRDFRKRRTLRVSNAYFLSRKAQRPLTTPCGCEPPLACIVCASKVVTHQPLDQDTMTMPERVALLRASFHPVLSFPHEIPLQERFGGLLKQPEWQTRLVPKAKANNVRKFCTPNKWGASGGLLERKLRQKVDMGQLPSERFEWSSMLLEKSMRQYLERADLDHSLLEPSDTEGDSCSPNRKRRRSGTVLVPSKRQRNLRSCSFTVGECPDGALGTPLRNTQTPVLCETPTAPSTSSQTSTPTLSSSAQNAVRRRRGESSYDINNIVIPLSMAAPARVEKIQYKEILTPGWQELEPVTNMQEVNVEEEEVEDLSDEAFAIRHAKCEQLEKARWCVWSPAIQRRTRSFHKSVSDGRATPPPPSPDTSMSGGGGEQLSYTEPAMQQRMTDRSMRDSSLCESTRSSTPDINAEEVFVVVQPWERRTFPLREEEEAALAGGDEWNSADGQDPSSPLDVVTPVNPDSPIPSRNNMDSSTWQQLTPGSLAQGVEKRVHSTSEGECAQGKRNLRSTVTRLTNTGSSNVQNSEMHAHHTALVPPDTPMDTSNEVQRWSSCDYTDAETTPPDEKCNSQGSSQGLGRTRAGTMTRYSAMLRTARRTNSL